MSDLACEVSVNASLAISAGIFSVLVPLVAMLWLDAKIKITRLKLKIYKLEMELEDHQ